MDQTGFVLDALDLKLLILFILRRLPSEIETDRLFHLIQQDGVVNYFDFTVALDELCESGQVISEDGFCSITDRGRNNAETVESSLPFSVRQHASAAASAEADEMSRRGCIQAAHTVSDGVCTVELSLSDGISELLSLRLLCADEKQAKSMEKTFRRHAEETYQKIVTILSE
ncbi:MAG: DUF4364 family protein [Oscillospiraceae bacterium]|nr:DUF4364 family protein [Oscillospiraceae bacterium]